MLLFISLAVGLLFSCDKAQEDESSTQKEQQSQDETQPDEDLGADAFKDWEQVPISGEITHVQPMTGIVLWTDNDNCESDDIALEFSYLRYSDVCKSKDVYDWSKVDNLLKKVASHKHQAVLRFYYTYVGDTKGGVPDYIKSRSDYTATTGKPEGEKTAFPDWRCEELQRFHLEFYKKFIDRYENDPRLAFLETGFGLWAEYHIYEGPFILGQTFPSKDFQKKFFALMDECCKELPWCISIDAADPKYSPFDDAPGLLNGRFGNFDDSFQCEEHDEYNFENWEFFGTTRYRRAPLGGEFSYYEDYDQEHCLDPVGIYGFVFEKEAARYHLTFIIGNDQPDYQSMSRIKEASMATGYRFCVADFRRSGDKVAVYIKNNGVAPIYRDAYIVVDGNKGPYSLKNLMPGSGKWVEIGGISSENPEIRISCDHLVSGQSIEFETPK